MTSNFKKDDIIDYVKRYNSVSFISLVKRFNIPSFKNKWFSSILNELKLSGKIAFNNKTNEYFIPKFVTSIVAEIITKQNDFGFVFFNQDNEEKKAIIFRENFNNAINKDIVKIDIFEEQNNSQLFFGIVKEIIERKQKFIFGLINHLKEFEPVGFSNKFSFFFDKKLVCENSYVKFEIQSIDKNNIYLNFISTISLISKPYSDLDFIVNMLNIDNQFNNDVQKEAELIPNEVIMDETMNIRKDLRSDLIVTIDGEKTKDFDDAINVKKTNKGIFIASIHIADVAYYVKEDSAIDKQALSRATSIYLLDKVIPMLPEKLSNGICSLNPNVDRFTLSLEVEINSDGKILNKRIFPAVINSKYRLTYKQVDNYKNEQCFKDDPNLFKMISDAYELSSILLQNKRNNGYIDFEIEESIIDVDENGKAIGLRNKKRLSSEVLIENLMVLANEVVSKIVADLGFPSIYRVHEAPSEEKYQTLEQVLKVLKLKDINVLHSTNPKDFLKLVEKIKGQRFDDFIKITLLRTMQKAKYSTDNIGHFGLASKYYSHFTSPIRRYPDLMLHRLIWELIIKKNKNFLIGLNEKLQHVSSISSTKEEDALLVERKINDIKISEYYNKNINKVFEGTIVSIQKFGLFVELDDGANVFVHISKITNDFCKVNESNTLLISNDKILYEIGQKIKVLIISINKLEGKIDAQIVNEI